MLPEHATERLHHHLASIYGETVAHATAPRFVALLERFLAGPGPRARERATLFDETDVVLITYGDQVQEPGRPALQTLREFIAAHLRGAVSGVHLLPHYPATSDDGFAVADFLAVDPALGEWRHVEELARDVRLMLDAAVNHTSASHPWFTGWLSGDPRYADFYIQVDPAADVASVTRPRTSPLLTPFGEGEHRRWAWTTFSADQVDLNYANPEVLLAVTDVLLTYVARGARALRLDAVAFLWKRLGTTCMHLPETHEVIRLWRMMLDAVAPGTLIVTETNVPHRENVTYFGSGTDEAHLVYQFALPPLTLAAFHSGDASRLSQWAAQLGTPSTETTFLNFLASHDGIGLRPVEGLLDRDEVDALADAVLERGGRISYRVGPDGRPSPYELNSVYFDALRPSGAGEDRGRDVDRFLAAHSILLALAGVPAVYVHSLLGSRNWVEGVEATGHPRTVNRQRFRRAELESELADPDSLRRRVLDRLLARIAVRTAEPAFSPTAEQQCLPSSPAYFVVQRTAAEAASTVVCVHDVSGRPGRCRLHPAGGVPPGGRLVDVCDGSEHVAEPDGVVDVPVPAYGVRWLRRVSSRR